MLLNLEQSSNLMAYKEMKGKFDWNKTAIAPLGMKAMIYIVTNVRTTCLPNCDKVFVMGMAPHQYHPL